MATDGVCPAAQVHPSLSQPRLRLEHSSLSLSTPSSLSLNPPFHRSPLPPGRRGIREPGCGAPSLPSTVNKQEKTMVSRTSLILWRTHQNDAAAVRKLLKEDPGLVNAHEYDKRTTLHVTSLHGWIDIAKCLLEFGANVNA